MPAARSVASLHRLLTSASQAALAEWQAAALTRTLVVCACSSLGAVTVTRWCSSCRSSQLEPHDVYY